MEIKVIHQIMEWNEDVSDENKRLLDEKKVCLINVMGSPGAGKTSLLTSVINKLSGKYRAGVIEADIAGLIDAEKMQKLGVPVVQLNTDGACHIEALSIQKILGEFDLENIDVLFIENVGNLVCPAEFRLGEDFRIAILSIPEGDDKIEKYPLMFAETDALVLNKYDMLRYFDFDVKRAVKNQEEVNPGAEVFCVSSTSGEGIDEICRYISGKIDKKLL